MESQGIGVTGKYGHGKNHFASVLARREPALTEVSAGRVLKDVCGVLLPGARFETPAEKDTPIDPREHFWVESAACALLGMQVGLGWRHTPTPWSRARTLGEVYAAFEEVLSARRPRTRGELLQIVGTEIGRERIDPDLWVHLLEGRIRELIALGIPWIVTDVRYENEIRMVLRLGGVVLRMEAPALTPGLRDHRHPSETSLDHVPLPTFVNDRSPEQDRALDILCCDGISGAIRQIGNLEIRPSRFWK